MRTLTRRFVLLAAMTAPLGAYGVHAQSNPQGNPLGWPAGTIKLIVPYPPGGSTDVIARLVQPDAAAAARTHRHHRESGGRVGQRRHGDGGKVAAGWRHVAHGLRQPRRQPVRAAEPAVRHRKGSRPRAVYRHGALRRLDPAAEAIQVARRRDRCGQGQAGCGQLRLGRQRQHRPPRHGAAVEAGRRAAGPRALSRRRPGHERRGRRPCRSSRRQHRAVDPADSGRHAAGAWCRPARRVRSARRECRP